MKLCISAVTQTVTSISSPSLVSSRVHAVLGPSPFCKVCSQLILLSVSHFGKLCRDPCKKHINNWHNLLLFKSTFCGLSGTMSFTTHKNRSIYYQQDWLWSCTEIISICFFCAELLLVILSLGKHWYAWTDIIQDCFIQSRGMCTVQGRPSTVVSLKDWPTVNEMCVVRTLVDVLMDRLSPCWVISTAGLDAAVTAIFLRNTFTPDHTQTDLTSDFWRL